MEKLSAKQICKKCCKEKCLKDFSYKKKICFSCCNDQQNKNANVNYRLKKSLASQLRKVLLKNETTMHYIGCNIQYLREWLEYNFLKDMTWDNYGTHWFICHVVPLCKFNLTDENEKRKCWNWSNLMPCLNGTQPSDIDNITQKINKFKEEGSTTKWFSGDILTLDFAKSKLDVSS